MSERPAAVRSYQRVFAPDRRIYAVDGRTIPIPGGVPLRWLATATLTVLAVVLLAALSAVVILGASAVAGFSVLRLGRRRLALPVVVVTASVLVVAGVLLDLLEWPLRLVVVPAAVATLATQVAPDGRGAPRFVCSWLRTQLAGRRQLGQSLPRAGERRGLPICVRVAADSHGPTLQRAVVSGPGCVRFRSPVTVHRGPRGRVVRPLGAGRRPRGLMVDRLQVADGERIRVRP